METSACFPIITFFSPPTKVFALIAPNAVLYFPMLFIRALYPNAVLLCDFLLLFKEREPTLVFWYPSLFFSDELNPTAVLFPLVLFFNAFLPNMTLGPSLYIINSNKIIYLYIINFLFRVF